MVYCGRPSTSCGNCRVKRRRCDKVEPACGQCRRMGQTCPGYRDASNLMFRDESSRVIDRVLSKTSKVTKKAASSSKNVSERLPSAVSQTQALPSPASFGVAFEELLGDMNGDMDTGFMSDFLNFNCHFDLDNAFQLPNSPATSGPTLTDTGSGASPDLGQVPVAPTEGFFGSQGGLEGTHGVIAARPLDVDLFPSTKKAAVDYFLSNYVLPRSGASPGYLDYVPTLLSQGEGCEILEGAVVSLGLRGLAKTKNDNDLLTQSAREYKRIAGQMDSIISDPQAARRDSTIIVLLVLAHYEFSCSSIEGWSRHIQSVASLLPTRGKAQLGNPLGLSIFKDTFTTVLTSCACSHKPIPSKLRVLRIEAGKAFGLADPVWINTSAMVQMLDLYHRIAPNGYSFTSSTKDSNSTPFAKSSTSDHLTMDNLELYLSQALDIDYQLESAFSDDQISSELRFSTVQDPRSPTNQDTTVRIPGGVRHVYQTINIAEIWNSLRVCRILANHAIAHLLLRGATMDRNWFFSNGYADQLQQVTKTLGQLRHDLVASVPQQTDPTGPAIGGYFATWGLLAVGCMHSLEDSTRVWVAGQLRGISEQWGLGQAGEFGEFVELNRLHPPLD